MFSIVIAAVTLLIAGGCGGSGGGSSHHSNDLTGNYTGSAPVQTGYTGTLNFSVIPGGSAEGSLVVTPDATTPRALDDGIPPGNYPMSGTLDGNGNLNLGGMIGGTPVTVTATIVGNGSGSNAFIMSFGVHTWEGTVTKGDDPGDGGEVEADMTFSGASGTNADTTHFPSGTVTANFDTDEADVFLHVTDANGRTFGVTVPNSLDVGDTYTFDSLHQFSTYAQPGSDDLFRDTWAADSGTMTLVARNGTHVSVILTNVHYTAVTFFGNGTGSFTANGSFHN